MRLRHAAGPAASSVRRQWLVVGVSYNFSSKPSSERWAHLLHDGLEARRRLEGQLLAGRPLHLRQVQQCGSSIMQQPSANSHSVAPTNMTSNLLSTGCLGGPLASLS